MLDLPELLAPKNNEMGAMLILPVSFQPLKFCILKCLNILCAFHSCHGSVSSGSRVSSTRIIDSHMARHKWTGLKDSLGFWAPKTDNLASRGNSSTLRGGSMKPEKASREAQALSRRVGRALRRAAKVTRKTARMHNTPIYIWKDGKVVAIKP